jgi:hypothetical protein
MTAVRRFVPPRLVGILGQDGLAQKERGREAPGGLSENGPTPRITGQAHALERRPRRTVLK